MVRKSYKSFRSVRTLDELIDKWSDFEPKPPAIQAFAFLLYSSLSQEIAKYIDRYCKELDDMAGPDFIVLVVNELRDFVSKYETRATGAPVLIAVVWALSLPFHGQWTVPLMLRITLESLMRMSHV